MNDALDTTPSERDAAVRVWARRFFKDGFEKPGSPGAFLSKFLAAFLAASAFWRFILLHRPGNRLGHAAAAASATTVGFRVQVEVPMKVHVFQHVPFEDLGAMHGWFHTKGASVAYTRWFDAPTLPHDEPDLLVVLGGPLSVNDEALYPWLVEEKRYIARAIEKELPVLGVCLGAQLMASALGARVYPNPDKEIGWLTIQGTGASSLFEKELEHRVFQWHGETFDLPHGATLLARSDACEKQAFSCGGAAVGLQFHLEVTPLGASALLEHCQSELVAGPYVQSAAQILTERKETYGEMHRLMGRVLTQVTTCAI